MCYTDHVLNIVCVCVCSCVWVRVYLSETFLHFYVQGYM